MEIGNRNENLNESQSENQLKNENVVEEIQIKKKKSFIPIIIAVVVLIIAGVIVYFSFFSEAAVRDREIKAHIASAENYLDDLDYENALADYEAILKLDPTSEDAREGYVNTTLAWSEDVADDDLEKAMEILEDAIKFLEKNASEKGVNDEYIEKLQNKLDEYISNLEDADDDETDATDDESDVASVDEDVEVANYTSEIIDVNGIVGDSWWWIVSQESIICVDCIETDPYGNEGEFEDDYEIYYKPKIRIYDFNGNLIKEMLFDKDEAFTADGTTVEEFVSNFNVFVLDHYHGRTGMVLCINTQGPTKIYLYDYLGNLNSEIQIKDMPYCGWDYKTPFNIRYTVDEQYLAVTAQDWVYDDPEVDILTKGVVVPLAYIDCDSETIEYVYAYDDNWNVIKKGGVADHEMISALEYDEEQFLYCIELEDVNSEAKYLVETIDEQWGYADEDFNILALYEDASAFNIYGYALVSDDGESYDLINANFEVIEENFAQGNSAYANNLRTMLIVENGENRTFYLVKGEDD